MTIETSHDRFLALLRDLCLDLARFTRLEEALDRILEAALASGGADCGGVYLAEDEGAPSLVAVRGVAGDFLGAVTPHETDSLQANIVRQARVQHWGGAEIARLGLPDTDRGPILALVALPILLDGRAIGTFNLASRTGDTIPDGCIARFEVLAAQASTAVMRAHAQRDLEEREALFRSLYEKAPLAYQSLDTAGEFVRSYRRLTDVTELRRTDTETRALLAEQQLILDNAVVGLAVFRNRHFFACNAYFENLLGYPHGELIGQSAEMIHRDHEHFVERGQRIYAALADGRNFEEEMQFRRKDGSPIWLHVTGRAVDPARPTEDPSVWIFVDLSERRRAENLMRSMNATLEQRVAERTAELESANRELEGFSYSVSHDLRAPLRAINGFAQLLIEDEHARLSDEGRNMLDRIVRNSNRMGDLIDDILEYSRTGRAPLTRRVVDLDYMARTVAKELGETYPAARIEVAPLPVVVGDSTMLRQVLENLIGNALKYSSKRKTPLIEIGCNTGNDMCEIRVKDNGTGFDMEYSAKLFGVFQRLHSDKDFPGTGVGLAICKRIIERHDGRIWTESRPDLGASFFFTLPLASQI